MLKTKEAEALYILVMPKTIPMITDCTGLKRHPAARIGMYAVVTEIGGI